MKFEVAGMFPGVPGSQGQSFLLGYFTTSLLHWGTRTPKDHSASWLSNDSVTTEPGVWEPVPGELGEYWQFFASVFQIQTEFKERHTLSYNVPLHVSTCAHVWVHAWMLILDL